MKIDHLTTPSMKNLQVSKICGIPLTRYSFRYGHSSFDLFTCGGWYSIEDIQAEQKELQEKGWFVEGKIAESQGEPENYGEDLEAIHKLIKSHANMRIFLDKLCYITNSALPRSNWFDYADLFAVFNATAQECVDAFLLSYEDKT